MDPKAPPPPPPAEGLGGTKSANTIPGGPTDPKGFERVKRAVSWHDKVDPMNIQMNLQETRFRTAGMTPEERAWRKKWVLDQKLHENEPLDIDTRPRNPIRRLFGIPGDYIQDRFLNRMFGWYNAQRIRRVTLFLSLMYCGSLVVYYIGKYNRQGWESRRGITVYQHPKIGQVFRDQPFVINREEIEEKYPGMLARLEPNSPLNKEGANLVPLEEAFRNRTILTDLGPPQRP